MCDGIEGLPDGFAVGVDGLQLGAEQFAGVGVNVLDFQPVGLCGRPRFDAFIVWLLDVVVGVVVGEPAEEQVGEQVGAALLVGARIVGAEAAGRGGEHAVDGGGVWCRYFAGHIADAVGALHHGDAAFGQGAAMPLFEGERLQPHHQSQQPDVELFRGSGVRGLDDLVVDGGQGGGFGDASRDPVDHPDLLGIHITTLGTRPRRWADLWRVGGCGRAGTAPGRADHAAAATTRRPQTHPASAASVPRNPKRVCQRFLRRSAHRRSAPPPRPAAPRRCGLPAGIRHRLPGRRAVMLATPLVIVLVIPRHEFIVPATTDSFRTYERRANQPSAWRESATGGFDSAELAIGWNPNGPGVVHVCACRRLSTLELMSAHRDGHATRPT